VDLRALVARLASVRPDDCASGYRSATEPLAPAEAARTLTDETGRERGQVVLTGVRIGRQSTDPRTRATTGPFRLEGVSGLVFVRE
jgi:hypothetical protein